MVAYLRHADRYCVIITNIFSLCTLGITKKSSNFAPQKNIKIFQTKKKNFPVGFTEKYENNKESHKKNQEKSPPKSQ